MDIKDKINTNRTVIRIKLDDSDAEKCINPVEEKISSTGNDKKNSFVDEWKQEYEMIYLSYVLEK